MEEKILAHKVLGNVLSEGHETLAAYSSFALNIHSPYMGEAKWYLDFVAEEGYDRVCADILHTDTKEELIEWLSNTDVSIPTINKVVREIHTYWERYEATIAETEEWGRNAGLMVEVETGTIVISTGERLTRWEWDWDQLEGNALFEDYMDYFDGNWPIINTLEELNRIENEVLRPFKASFSPE